MQEYRGVDKGQINLLTIHIIDVLFLNGINLLLQNDKIISYTDRYVNIYSSHSSFHSINIQFKNEKY